LEIGVLAWVDVTANTAYALSVEQTPPALLTDPEQSRIDAYVQHLTRVITAHPWQPVPYLVVDGYFGKKKVVDGVCGLCFHIVGKLWRALSTC
jgi:predicted component of type VI protein secretion system